MVYAGQSYPPYSRLSGIWLPHTAYVALIAMPQVREGSWKVSPLPSDLQDRRVEITGPTDAKMVINALNRRFPPPDVDTTAIPAGCYRVSVAIMWTGPENEH